MDRQTKSEAGAAALWQSHCTRILLDTPPFMLDDQSQAYHIQDLVARELGLRSGWKLGLNGSGEVIAAPLHQSLTYKSPATLQRRSFNRMLIESELAVVFTQALPPRKSPYKVADIFESLGTVHAAIEIVDSRFTHWPDVDPLWLLADGMSHGCFVLGSGVPLTQRVLLDHGQYDLHLDGLEIASGAGDHPLPNPFATIASLATRLSQQGRGILAGDILTTGTFSGVTEVNAGQTATLKFHGIGECSVVVRA